MDLMDKLASLAQRYEELNALMAQPEILDDISMLQRYGREHAELEEVVNKYHEIVDNDRQIAEAQEMFESDDLEMRDLAFEELERLKARREKLLEEVKILLLPKDIMDDKNAIVTIQAGAGGDEAALFAGELFRMYTRYTENKRWKIEILDINETGQGGIKDITFVVKGKGAYQRLKYEGGTHRVQRVPVTEANGRIHTSTAKVIVLPEADDDIEIDIKESDIRVDVYRSTGHGGQSVNTTDSAVRITHIPTGLVASCQNERSQHKNRDRAMSMLRSKLYELELEKKREASRKIEDTKLDIDFGSQIRSYVLQPYRMVKDHRTKEEAGDVDRVLDGDLQRFIQSYLRMRRGGKS